MAGLTLNAMVFKHSQYPNAAKAFLQFMLEKEQYEPWLNAAARLLVAAAGAPMPTPRCGPSDPKVKIFKDTMKSTVLRPATRGRSRRATGAVSADYVLVQMCASRCDRRRDAGGARPRKPSAAPSGISAQVSSAVANRRMVRKHATDSDSVRCICIAAE